MIALDIESSSADPATGSIISLGAVDTDDTNNQFYDECRIWDGAHVKDEALKVNGFTRDEVVDLSKKSEAELIAAFVAWATDRPINTTFVSQNPSFDYGYVLAACDRANIEFPFARRTLDIHTLVWLHMVGQGIEPPMKNKHSDISLDTALQYCGIPEEPHPHNGLTGALSHAEVFNRIAYNKKSIEAFSNYELPWSTKKL
ncbi:hypothetical protein KKH15_03055 [Patescibacteria group bacterium]|nr:hypothetical protein [Patescibacteria group bacterium]MBU1754890.1 hypothetical protein [Patescibacteria group bacterium]